MRELSQKELDDLCISLQVELPIRKEVRDVVACIGASGTGKTTFVINYLNTFYWNNHVIWYRPAQDIDLLPKHFEIRYGIPKISDIFDKDSVIVIDDQMLQLKDSFIDELVVYGKNHIYQIHLIFIVQQMFRDSTLRLITQNANKFACFRTPRNSAQFRLLGQQMNSIKGRELIGSAFEQATENQFGYLFIDISADVPFEFQIRNSIIPERNFIPEFYIHKNVPLNKKRKWKIHNHQKQTEKKRLKMQKIRNL